MADKITRDDDLAAVSADMKQLREELNALTETIGKLGRDGADALGRKAGRMARGLESSAGEAYATVASEGQRYARNLEATVADRPFGSMMIAVAVGFVLGTVLGRSGRS